METIPMQERSNEAAPAPAEQYQQPAMPAQQPPQYVPQPAAAYPPQYPPQAPQYGRPMPQYPPQQMPHAAPCAPKDPEEKKGLAVTGFVFGVIGMLLSGVPVLNFILALVSIICSAMARAKGGCVARAYGAAGLTTGILTAVAVLGQIMLASVIVNAINRLMELTGAMTDLENLLPFLNMIFEGGMY